MLTTIVTENSEFENVLSKFFPVPQRGLDSLLEQVAENECKNPKVPILRGINHERKIAVFFRPRCGLWSCPQCAKINQEIWTWRASLGGRELAKEYGHVDFLTLTSHEKLDAAASVDVWPDAWDKLRKRAGYHGGELQYFAVPERHKSGRLHVHAIIATRAQLPKKFWKNAARACGMGYQADSQEVENEGGVGGYVGKYLSKTLQYSNWARGFRRVRTSQGWPKLPSLPQEEGWNFETLPKDIALYDALIVASDLGYEVHMTGHKTAWKYVNEKTLD
jgi:hypothetical protein